MSGSCPKDYKPMENFDKERYMGDWYEQVRDKYTPFEIGAGCQVASYALNDDGSIAVKNYSHQIWRGWDSGEGTAIVADTGDASLIVDFDEMPNIDDVVNYTVLDTDYDTYTVVYSCDNFMPFAYWDFLWILSREKKLDSDTLRQVIGTIRERLPDYDFFNNVQRTRTGWTCRYDQRE